MVRVAWEEPVAWVAACPVRGRLMDARNSRRAERRVLALREDRGGVPEGLVAYLNRLSDALFVLARYLNALAGIPEPEWRAQGMS